MFFSCECPFHGTTGLLQDNSGDDTYSIFLQNAETVALITDATGKSIARNEQYLLLAVMSELSTVQCDRVLGLWL